MQAHGRATANHHAVSSLTRLAIWTFAWVVTLALARFGPIQLWDSGTLIGWVALGINVAVGVGLVVVHARYLQSLDELQRKIMLDAMAVTLGVGLVAGCAYGAAANADLIAADADIGLLFVLMGVTYLLATIASNRRYR